MVSALEATGVVLELPHQVHQNEDPGLATLAPLELVSACRKRLIVPLAHLASFVQFLTWVALTNFHVLPVAIAEKD